MDVSSCSVDLVPDLCPFLDLSLSNWLGVYSRGFPCILHDCLGNSATIKTFNHTQSKKISIKNPKVSKETTKLITHLENLRDQTTHKQ